MRPLYIEGCPGCRVVLDEPALRVVVPEQSDRLFPLSRVSRVVCSGVVDWSMSALLACADAGITLLFLQKNGEVRARWLGQSGVRQSLTQRVVDLLVRPDGLSRYENWSLAMEKLAVRSFARKMGMAQWREVPVADMRKQIACALPPLVRLRVNVLTGLLRGEINGWLDDYGYASGDEVIVNSQIDLAGDISNLLLWDCVEDLLSGSRQNWPVHFQLGWRESPALQ